MPDDTVERPTTAHSDRSTTGEPVRRGGTEPVLGRAEFSGSQGPDGFGLNLATASRRILSHLLDRVDAERAFFMVRHAPSGDEKAVEPLEVVAALGRDLTEIRNAAELVDHHYLGEISVVDGIRMLTPEEDGSARTLLTCSFAVDSSVRGLVVLDAPGGTRAFGRDSTRTVEDTVRETLHELRALYTVDALERGLNELEGEQRKIEQKLEMRELELGGVRSVLEEEQRREEVSHYHQIITRSASVQELFDVIERVKDTDLSVLITGETGTGKELFARAIHYGGNRAAAPFEEVACGSLSSSLLESELFGYRKGAFSGADSDRKGIFERAHGGTAFLDGVEDMPTEMQKKILRVLQERVIRPIGAEQPVPVDVRVIASTQQDLSAAVRDKKFREDLYYRLNVITLDVPPLRSRRDDIALLIDHFLADLAEEEGVNKRFSESALRELYNYAWPGNVQELRNVVTRAFLVSPRRVISRQIVTPLLKNQSGDLFPGDGLVQEGDHITLTIPYSVGFNNLISECEKLILLNALRRNRGNKSRVTQQLRIPRQTLYNKIDKHGIAESDYMGSDS